MSSKCTFPMEFWKFYLFRIPVEVQIWHDLPWVLPWDCSSHPEHLPSQHPPHQSNRMVTLPTNELIRDAVNMLVMNLIYTPDGLTLLLQGIAMSTYLNGESVLQRAMVGMLTYDASVSGWWSARGSVTIKSRGSLKAAWIWLVNVPGVNRPWKVVAPVAAANFRTALYNDIAVYIQGLLIFEYFQWSVAQVTIKCQSQDSSPHALLKTEHSQFSTPPTPRHWHCCLALTVCTLSLGPKNIYKFTCPVFLEEMTHTSAGFSMATMALAAKSSFSHVFFKLMMYTPKLIAEQIHFHMQVSKELIYFRAIAIFSLSVWSRLYPGDIKGIVNICISQHYIWKKVNFKVIKSKTHLIVNLVPSDFACLNPNLASNSKLYS